MDLFCNYVFLCFTYTIILYPIFKNEKTMTKKDLGIFWLFTSTVVFHLLYFIPKDCLLSKSAFYFLDWEISCNSFWSEISDISKFIFETLFGSLITFTFVDKFLIKD